jgi:putative alpha-1,2-mannosidase
MSAWYLFSMMGFYPVNPCGDGYVLGAAQAEEIKLGVKSCEWRSGEFRIVRSGDGEGVMFNGKVVNGFKISHEEIMRGGVLSFE